MRCLLRILGVLMIAATCATPCFAQRDGARQLCQGLPNVPTGICFSHEYDKANSELKVLIAKIRKTLSPEEQKKLMRAQQSWRRYRELICEVDSTVYFGGGSGENTEGSRCLYIETRLQVKDLHSIYDWEMRPH